MAENKLITLAIRTTKRAERIKQELENNGIETVIQNINIDVPAVNVGVRIRIHENDLPRALRIVEEVEKAWETQKNENDAELNSILIPIEFTDVVYRTVDLGFLFARTMGVEVVFLHVYYVPAYTINDMSVYSLSNSEKLRRAMQQAETERDKFTTLIKSRINSGELPDVPFRVEMTEGVADDEIIEYCRRHRPKLVVMGTRGAKKMSGELIGSVTGEVLETCVSPVFAVPLQSALQKPEDVQRIAFLTNFEDKDLIAIDSALSLFANNALEVFFLHVSEKDEVWNEIVLSGIKDYFTAHYPNVTAHYDNLNAVQCVSVVSDYIAEQRIDLLAFNARKRNLFVRLFNPSLAYKMALKADTPLFVTHN